MSLTRNQLNSWLKTIEIDCDKVGDIGVADNLNSKRVKSFRCNKYICFDIIKTDYCQEILDLNKPYPTYPNYFGVIS